MKFLTIEATKWQYTHGVRNENAISPDNWNLDPSFLERPGNNEIQLNYSMTTDLILRYIPNGKSTLESINHRHS